ncbi:beta-glucuronosyltransferase GlcAT14A-like [Chenopodium quinoa]|uniref:beta-glucuronosyltransferase GlcAT14A-like n=1 Tax=Chenopodium quinoa TaxID=63459 RepID=UPI000B778CBB|nr:beta-glucuronosyltransferase GlcAT14A-like [Chenopodium quinoa]
MGTKKLMLTLILSSIIIFLVYILTILTKPTIIPTNNSFKLVIKPNITKTYPVTFAYLISASTNDVLKLKRTLLALYHPGNYYLIHFDYGAPKSQHLEVAEFVSKNEVFSQVGNVWIIGKPNLVTYRGPTMLSATLHAISILLKTCQWDWFINLSASDYPLVTQDDLIHAFSDVPRDSNFVQHSSRLGWKLNKRGKPVIIDPALYSLNKSQVWWAVKQRGLPSSFKLFTGSAWTVLSRSFAEYCIVGWENLPRTLLLYYTNFVSSPEGYFQTVICNSQDYKNTTINHDLHYISWDNPPKQHPRSLGLKDFRRMVLSNRPFARKFKKNDRVLDKIDREILKRIKWHDTFSYGGWCGGTDGGQDSCSGLKAENYGVLKPGAGSRRLKTLLTKLVSARKSSKHWCR